MSAQYDVGCQFVGIDLHRRRSVVARIDGRGELLESVRIDNSPEALVAEVGKAGPSPKVALEATFGWYWAVDALRKAGAEVHLVHPRGVPSMQNRRVKTDFKDARELADLLRVNRLAEAYIAPPELRALRELVRHRHKLSRQRTSLKASIHAVLGKCGVIPEYGCIFGPKGQQLLDSLELPEPYSTRLASQRRMLSLVEVEVADVEVRLARLLKDEPNYLRLRAIHGIGPIFAATMLAEIGDVHRFTSADAFASWTGLTPRHLESDTHLRRGHISKQGSRLLRWSLVEAVQRSEEPAVVGIKDRIIARRGKQAKQIAKVAAARRLAHIVFYTLRDGEARCLTTAATARPGDHARR